MTSAGTNAPTSGSKAGDDRGRVDVGADQQNKREMVFTPYEGVLGTLASKELPSRSDVEPARQGPGETDDDSLQLDAILGTSMIEPPLEWHAAILSDPRLAQPANGVQRSRVVTRLQHNYGNAHVQRVIDRVQADTQGDPAREAVSDDLEQTIAGERGQGAPIESGTRAQMEAAFGADFGDVNVHTDDKADDLARALQAKAFTTGRDVFFKEGEYDPAGSDGQRLIAHELTHVVQQGGGGASGPVQREVQPPEVSAATTETGTIQRDKRKRGSLIERRLRQHERAIEEAKGTTQPAKPMPPKKVKAVPPKVPAKTYSHVRPGELVEEGGAPSWFFGKTYRGIVEQAKQYRANKRKSPTDYKGQWAALDKLTKSIRSWRKKFKIFSRKARRQALSKLEAQIRKERPRLVPHATKKGLIVSAQLEKHDGVKHREGLVLEYCYARWQKAAAGNVWDPREGPPPPGVYDYATALEGSEDAGLLKKVRKVVAEKIGGAKADAWIEEKKRQGRHEFIPRITYVPAAERERYRVQFSGPDASYAATGEQLDPKKDYIYVMTPGGEYYAAEETSDTQLKFHHSSFLEGAGVAAAGHMKFSYGDILLDLESGHYQPGMQHMYNAVNALDGKVPLDKLRVTPLYEVKMQVYGNTFLEGVRALKAGKGKENASVAKLMKRYLQVRASATKLSQAQRKDLINELKGMVQEVKT